MAKKSETSIDAVDEAQGATVEDSTDDGLVEVCNGSETLRVHPTCVKAHVEAGWAE